MIGEPQAHIATYIIEMSPSATELYLKLFNLNIYGPWTEI